MEGRRDGGEVWQGIAAGRGIIYKRAKELPLTEGLL